MSKDGSGNLLGPSLTLDIERVLKEFDENERAQEQKQVTFVLLRNISALRKIYGFYSALGHDRSRDSAFVMTKFQFWRFLKDCHIHHHNFSLSAIDRIIAKSGSIDIHSPMEKIVLREFLSHCVVLSVKIYSKQEKSDEKKSGLVSRCLKRLIDDHILKFSGRVRGQFLGDPRRSINAHAYMERSWRIYQSVCTQRTQPPHDESLCMRQFLFLLKDLKIIGSSLNTKDVLQILAADDPCVSDGESCNLELEMTFLEFFEALIGIAANFNSSDSRPQMQSPQSSRLKPDAKSNTASPTPSNTSRKGDGKASLSPASETRGREEEFNIWCSKLHKFFTQHFFPSWKHAETLRYEVAKNKAERERRGGDEREELENPTSTSNIQLAAATSGVMFLMTRATSYETSSVTESELQTYESSTTGVSRASSSSGFTSASRSEKNQ